MSQTATTTRRRWLAPEIVQTSTMDCGPATLACALEGFRIPVSFGRLREACQTDVDGTSIDAIETVANQLGLNAVQVMLPPEQLFLSRTSLLPAIIVVRHADQATHFVVVWRRVGPYLQVMDPSIGRRWVTCKKFAREVFQHEQRVLASDWRSWAATAEFSVPLRDLLESAGASPSGASTLLKRATQDPHWFGLASLDACLRFVNALIDAGGMRPGKQAAGLIARLFERTLDGKGDVFRLVPRRYWSVSADQVNVDGALELLMQGTVILKITGKPSGASQKLQGFANEPTTRAPEIYAAAVKQPGPVKTIWGFLQQDGLLGPLALGGAVAIAVAVVLIELLLFRGLFEITNVLNLPSQRLAAVFALLCLMGLIMVIEVPVSAETMRIGRRLEVRLRMALLEKLPHLGDRYFRSRPVSDMADRSHNIHFTRMVPALGLHLVSLGCDLALTLTGVYFIDPLLMLPALGLVAIAVALPLVAQPFLNERDLRVRNHGAALNVFYLDALLGLVPIRTHRAERAVRRQHEGLLAEWARSMCGLNRVSLLTGSAQALVCVGLAAFALYAHFMRSGFASGADLLLIFWMLKLPALGGTFATMATQYPMQRNVLLRLLEPLTTPAEIITPPIKVVSAGRLPDTNPPKRHPPNALSASKGISLSIEHGSVLAAGHILLHGVNLKVGAGEHVAIVGSSGAGKSTLIGLILGWHRLATGEMRVDGATLAPGEIERLRRSTAWVDPAVQLWNRSFLDNLIYATDNDRPDGINQALESANLHRVLQSLPQGLQTLLGESGALLSGGEGQRLRLARAFMQSNVRLALLDEPFRGLDRGQRAKLLGETRRWWQDASLMCVTHDVAETRSFDRVLVVEGGRIVEDGAPDELGARPSRYRELLDAEIRVQQRTWSGSQWRHLHAVDGRIVVTQASGRATPATSTPPMESVAAS